MGISEIVGKKRGRLLKIAAKHGARNVRVFGSVALGQARKNSDVDLLVDMENGRTLLEIAGGLSPYLRDRIISQAVPL